MLRLRCRYLFDSRSMIEIRVIWLACLGWERVNSLQVKRIKIGKWKRRVNIFTLCKTRKWQVDRADKADILIRISQSWNERGNRSIVIWEGCGGCFRRKWRFGSRNLSRNKDLMTSPTEMEMRKRKSVNQSISQAVDESRPNRFDACLFWKSFDDSASVWLSFNLFWFVSAHRDEKGTEKWFHYQSESEIKMRKSQEEWNKWFLCESLHVMRFMAQSVGLFVCLSICLSSILMSVANIRIGFEENVS